MDHAMTTTAFTIDGFRITHNLGLVRGIVVRSRSIVGSFGAFLQAVGWVNHSVDPPSFQFHE